MKFKTTINAIKAAGNHREAAEALALHVNEVALHVGSGIALSPDHSTAYVSADDPEMLLEAIDEVRMKIAADVQTRRAIQSHPETITVLGYIERFASEKVKRTLCSMGKQHLMMIEMVTMVKFGTMGIVGKPTKFGLEYPFGVVEKLIQTMEAELPSAFNWRTTMTNKNDNVERDVSTLVGNHSLTLEVNDLQFQVTVEVVMPNADTPESSQLDRQVLGCSVDEVYLADHPADIKQYLDDSFIEYLAQRAVADLIIKAYPEVAVKTSALKD